MFKACEDERTVSPMDALSDSTDVSASDVSTGAGNCALTGVQTSISIGAPSGAYASAGTRTSVLSSAGVGVRTCVFTVVLAIVLAMTGFTLAGCASNDNNANSNSTGTTQQDSNQNTPKVTGTVSQDSKYGNVKTSFTPADFESAGFALGDTCDVTFGNGYTLTDIPYFNGYYVRTENPLVVDYPGETCIMVAKCNSPLWSASGLEDGMSVTITRNSAGKMLATQEALGQEYSNNRDDYKTDEQFSNFRALTGGNLKDNFLFRGASPVDNSLGRASITNNLLKNQGIATVIDLADSDSEIQKYFTSEGFSSDYARSLYDSGHVVTLAMSSSYKTDKYHQSVGEGMRFLLEKGGSAYIHCKEGKDRTGFVCFLVEALAGAGYDEMCADYMKTYDNYFGITKEGTPEKHDAVVSVYFNAFAEYLLDVPEGSDLSTGDYVQGARKYLANCGLSDQEIDQLQALISK